MKIAVQKSKHHAYTLVAKVGNGNFGEAYLVTSSLDNNKYIMKVPPTSHSEYPYKTGLLMPKSKSWRKSN